MRKKTLSLFLGLLVTVALAVWAQSPTTSAPPGSSTTQDPYGATLDHPNPNSANNANTPITDSNSQNSRTRPNQGNSNDATPAMSGSARSSTTTSTGTDNGSPSSSPAASDSSSLPRTASDLPLLAVIGLLALGSALMVRSIAKPKA
jgi:hypothetical protein